MRRKDREITDRKRIEQIIERSLICRIALCDGQTPYLVPLCFGHQDGCIFFHSAPAGKKLDIIRKNNRVCFEMESDMQLIRGASPCRWGMHYASVVGHGRAYPIEDTAGKIKALQIIFRHYSDAPCALEQEAVENVAVYKIVIESLSGKASDEPFDLRS